jgi:hypothetical protein
VCVSQSRDPSLRACEHTFVTTQGSAWLRLRRALDHGNLVEARSASSERKHGGLAEALELVLLTRDQEPAKYERAALRWHTRLCAEGRPMPLGEALAVVALEQLQGIRADGAARALSELLYRRGLAPACEVLMRWHKESKSLT